MTGTPHGPWAPDGGDRLAETAPAEAVGDFAEVASVVVVHDREQVRVVLAGEIDAACRAQLRKAGDRVLATDLPVVVHARRVTFMDCAGAAFLARLAVHRGHQRVVVVDAPPSVRFLLEVTRIDALVVFAPPSANPFS